MVTDETCKDKIVDDKYYSTKDLILNQSKNSLLGLVSLKDVFEVLLKKELKDDDIHDGN